MTKVAVLQNMLLDHLAGRLGPKGFRRKEQDYARNIPGGKEFVHLSFVRHQEDFRFTIDVAVRHDAKYRDTIRNSWLPAF